MPAVSLHILPAFHAARSQQQCAPMQSAAKKQIARVETMCHLHMVCQASVRQRSITDSWSLLQVAPTSLWTLTFVRLDSTDASIRLSRLHKHSHTRIRPHVTRVVEIDARSPGHPEASNHDRPWPVSLHYGVYGNGLKADSSRRPHRGSMCRIWRKSQLTTEANSMPAEST